MQKKQKKKTRRKKKGRKNVTPIFEGPWKRAGSSSTLSPKNRVFKILKNPIFKAFPEKMGGNHFFNKKAMLQGGQT